MDEIKRENDKWIWVERYVDRESEYIELRFGNAQKSEYEDWSPIALIGKPKKNTFPVRWLTDARNSDQKKMVAAACQELNFYLVDKNEPDPWAYAIYHCNTAANMYSDIHWTYFPHGDMGKKLSSRVLHLGNKEYETIFGRQLNRSKKSKVESNVLMSYVERCSSHELITEQHDGTSELEKQKEYAKNINITTDASFGIDDLYLTSQRPVNACPIIDCNKKPMLHNKFLICIKHGLIIHRSTYVYYNGDSPEQKKKACLRNLLPFGRDFAFNHILANPYKAESYRLGFEKSEDALTWNIFGGFLYYGRLHKIYKQLTGEEASPNQLELFLWGLKIDFSSPPRLKVEPWPCLLKVQKALESDIKKYRTEPDIMILGPTHLVCIEAKFTSGNTLALSGEIVEGEKPTSLEGLKERYIGRNKIWKLPVKLEDFEDKVVHSQLFRMLVFTGTMAKLEKRKWIVANLVSKTQWDEKKAKLNKYNDFGDPTPSIPSGVRENFKFISWEDDVYDKILKADPALVKLSEYMKNKTASLEKAFKISG